MSRTKENTGDGHLVLDDPHQMDLFGPPRQAPAARAVETLSDAELAKEMNTASGGRLSKLIKERTEREHRRDAKADASQVKLRLSRDYLTTELLISSLKSRVCPACGGLKDSRKTLCGRDYHLLPPALQGRLYSTVRRGYAQAVIEAFAFLEIGTFRTEAEK
jgi:hypothetical protein